MLRYIQNANSPELVNAKEIKFKEPLEVLHETDEYMKIQQNYQYQAQPQSHSNQQQYYSPEYPAYQQFTQSQPTTFGLNSQHQNFQNIFSKTEKIQQQAPNFTEKQYYNYGDDKEMIKQKYDPNKYSTAQFSPDSINQRATSSSVEHPIAGKKHKNDKNKKELNQNQNYDKKQKKIHNKKQDLIPQKYQSPYYDNQQLKMVYPKKDKYSPKMKDQNEKYQKYLDLDLEGGKNQFQHTKCCENLNKQIYQPIPVQKQIQRENFHKDCCTMGTHQYCCYDAQNLGEECNYCNSVQNCLNQGQNSRSSSKNKKKRKKSRKIYQKNNFAVVGGQDGLNEAFQRKAMEAEISKEKIGENFRVIQEKDEKIQKMREKQQHNKYENQRKIEELEMQVQNKSLQLQNEKESRLDAEAMLLNAKTQMKLLKRQLKDKEDEKDDIYMKYKKEIKINEKELQKKLKKYKKEEQSQVQEVTEDKNHYKERTDEQLRQYERNIEKLKESNHDLEKKNNKLKKAKQSLKLEIDIIEDKYEVKLKSLKNQIKILRTGGNQQKHAQAPPIVENRIISSQQNQKLLQQQPIVESKLFQNQRQWPTQNLSQPIVQSYYQQTPENSRSPMVTIQEHNQQLENIDKNNKESLNQLKQSQIVNEKQEK